MARRMSAAAIRDAAEIYRGLPAEERERLKRRGQEALLAWRAGYASFGPRKKRAGRDAAFLDDQSDIPGLDVVAIFDLEQDCSRNSKLLTLRL